MSKMMLRAMCDIGYITFNFNCYEKIIIYAVLLFLSASSFGQQNNPKKPLNHQDYLQKSKNQRTGALVLLAGGTDIGAVTAISFCQQTHFSQSLTRQDYVKKSKNQKTAAWVLLCGGVALAVGAPILAISSATWFQSDASLNVAFVTGCASILGSIPLFIASARNKRRSIEASAYFKIDKAQIIKQKGIGFYSFPAIALKLSLQ